MELKKWAIDSFPVDLKNRFIATAKVKGLTTPALLEDVVQDFLDKDGTINKEKLESKDNEADN